MQREVTLNAQTIEYTLHISKRARMMRLAIQSDGSLVVTAPHRMSESRIEYFITQKANWVIEKLHYVKSLPPLLKIPSSKKDFEKYRGAALLFAKQRIAHFNSIYNFNYGTISIKNQKTRWGSCSRKGNLNFNYKIILFTERVADYIIVHELCHLREFNHSAKFWALVEQIIPDHRDIRNMIRKGTMRV
jgi:predicted metal-dependent hydrolase